MPTLVKFFGRDTARELVAAGTAGRPDHRQQCSRPGAGYQRLRRWHEDPAPRPRRHHDGVPAPSATDGEQSVRHDLSRALLVLLVPDRRPDLRHARAGVVRRRGVADTRRFSAHLRTTSGGHQQAGRVTRRGACSRRELELGFDKLETYANFGEQVKATKRRLLEFLIDAKNAGRIDRRVRRSGQRQYAAQLLRDSDRLPRLHRRSQPLQARQVHAWNAHPDLPAGPNRRDAARLRADPALELQGRNHGRRWHTSEAGEENSWCLSRT